jgi:hypothetical protein
MIRLTPLTRHEELTLLFSHSIPWLLQQPPGIWALTPEGAYAELQNGVRYQPIFESISSIPTDYQFTTLVQPFYPVVKEEASVIEVAITTPSLVYDTPINMKGRWHKTGKWDAQTEQRYATVLLCVLAKNAQMYQAWKSWNTVETEGCIDAKVDCLMDWILQCAHLERYELINQYLAQLWVSEAEWRILSTTLRSTSTLRSRLPSWERVRAAIVKRAELENKLKAVKPFIITP